MSARVAPIDLKDVETKPEGKEDHGWGPNATFRYPNSGGAGYVWKKVSELVPSDWFSFRTELQQVDLSAKVATLKDMETCETRKYEYDYLITTIPLDLFGQLCSNPKLELNLYHTSVIIVGVAVEDELPSNLVGKTWYYFPDESPYYRITIQTNFFNDCTPDNNRFYSILCEISMLPKGDNVHLDHYAQRAVDRLVQQGFIRDAKKVHHTYPFLLPYGYPIPTIGRGAELRKAHTILEPRNVFSRGRFGGWKYEVSNQDFSFMQGAEAAGRILDGSPETVYTWK